MNITSKFIKKVAVPSLLVLAACQGPWDYWPEDPDLYKGVWVYAHVISDRPLQDVCFEKMLGLTETYVQAFAFFDSAEVSIQGSFSGSDTNVTLTQNPSKPNCFDGPADLRPVAGGRYALDATVHWDSSGTRVRSHFTANTYIPREFHVNQALAPAPALLENAFSDPRVLDAMVKEFGDTVFTVLSDTAAAVAFYQANSVRISNVLKSILSPYNENDTVFYMPPPSDLLSHYYLPTYSDDVGGVLITEAFDTLNAAKGENSFDFFFGQSPDTADKVDIGNRHRLNYLWNVDYGNSGNGMDSMAISNVWFVLGRTDFLFYATTPEYSDYVETAIYDIEDSRIRPKYNINGGAGIFAGMLVDTFSVYAKITPGAKAYPYMRARTLWCKDEGWDDENCRGHMPVFCAENGYRDQECWPLAVRAALDSGLVWNALVADTVPVDSLPSVRYGGEKKWCIAHNFPDSLATCQAEFQLALVSDTVNQSMRDVWNWCIDRNWPLATSPQCGTALVSWARINRKNSNVLDREIGKWCATYPADPQCKLR